MLEQLLRLSVEDYEENGGFCFRAIQFIPSGLTIDIKYIPGDGNDAQHWRIEATEVRDYVIRKEWMEEIEVADEHPILLPFTEAVTDLFFYQSPSDILKIVGDLLENHRKLVCDWIEFGRFFNAQTGKSLASLLTNSSGMLASGPVSLMNTYAEVLNQNGIKNSLMKPRPPKYWNGEQWMEQKAPLHALFLGTSYVIAERFKAMKK